MSTIKDVAKKAGVSITTVSIVMNGNAKKHSIPDETAERVFAAIKELNYEPNITARRLRSKAPEIPNIGVFWPESRNFGDLAAYIETLSQILRDNNTQINLMLQLYRDGQFENQTRAIDRNVYDALLIMTPAEKDIQFLEENKLSVPSVIINREVRGYYCTDYNRDKVASLALDAFKKKGIREISYVESDPIKTSISRADRLNSLFRANGIEVKEENILQCGDSLACGARKGENYDPAIHPHCILVDRDIAARGMIYSFNRRGLRCPEDYMIFTIAASRMENSMYCYPSLTEIVLPRKAILGQALKLLQLQLQGKEPEQTVYVFDPYIIYRESFPE